MYTVPETLVVAPSSQATRLSIKPRRRSGGALGSVGLGTGTSPGSNSTSPGPSPGAPTLGAPLGMTGAGSDEAPPRPLGTSTRGAPLAEPPALQPTAALAATATTQGVTRATVADNAPDLVPELVLDIAQPLTQLPLMQLPLMSHAPAFRPDTHDHRASFW